MPRTLSDFSKAIIYKIVCKNPNVDYCYVGSTTDLIRRKYKHKVSYKNEHHNELKYIKMRENGGYENFKFIVVENYPCNSRRELEKREDEIIRDLKANMNMIRPYVSICEKKIAQKEYDKNYGANNKIKKIKQRKLYKLNNPEKVKDINRAYYLKNKEKLSEKFICDCGGKYTMMSIKKHKETKKHQVFIKEEKTSKIFNFTVGL